MSEALQYWADLGDNRIGPILKELVAAIEETDDSDLLYRLAVRMKFMSGSVNSLSRSRATACKTSAIVGANNGG